MKAQAKLLIVLVATFATLGGCSDPEESARAALVDANEDWQAALRETDPRDRVAAFGEVIETLEGIVEDYPDTADGLSLIHI